MNENNKNQQLLLPMRQKSCDSQNKAKSELFRANREAQLEFLRLQQSEKLSVADRLKLSRMRQAGKNPLELILETARYCFSVNSNEALSLAESKLNRDGLNLTNEGKFLLDCEIAALDNDRAVMGVYEPIFQIGLYSNIKLLKTTQKYYSNIKLVNKNTNNIKYVNKIINIKDIKKLFNKEGIKSFRILSNGSDTVELDKTGCTVVLDEIWAHEEPDLKIYEVSRDFFNHNFSALNKYCLITFKINIFNNKSFYYIVIEDFESLNWLDLSYVASPSQIAKSGGNPDLVADFDKFYDVSYYNYNMIFERQKVFKYLIKINKQLIELSIKRSLNRSNRIDMLCQLELVGLYQFESELAKSNALARELRKILFTYDKLINLSIVNYLRDKQQIKANKALNDQELIDLAYNKPERISMYSILRNQAELRANINSGYRASEFESEKLQALSDLMFEEAGALDFQLTSQSEWNSIHKQYRLVLEEIASEFNDLEEDFEVADELEQMANALDRNWSKLQEFKSEDNWHPSELELAPYEPSDEYRSRYRPNPELVVGKYTRINVFGTTGEGKTAEEIMEDIGSVSLPITSSEHKKYVLKNKKLLNKSKAQRIKEYKELCKELDAQSDKDKGSSDKTTKYPCEFGNNPRCRKRYNELPLPNNNGIMLTQKKVIKAMALPNQEALRLKFKEDYYASVIGSFMVRAWVDAMRKHNRVVKHPKTSHRYYVDQNGRYKRVRRDWSYSPSQADGKKKAQAVMARACAEYLRKLNDKRFKVKL